MCVYCLLSLGNKLEFTIRHFVLSSKRLIMINQKEIFLKSEGNAWFRRNKNSLKDSSIEISLLCNWLSPFKLIVNHILEIGSGGGNKLSQMCWQLDASGIGVDPSSEAVQYANGEFGDRCKFIVGTSDNIDCNIRPVDLVHFGFCLYLVPRELLNKTFRTLDTYLKKGGFLSIIDFDTKFACYNEYHHVRGLKSFKENYADMLCKTGKYSLVNKFSFSHEAFCFTKDHNERIGLWLLYKD